MPEDAGSIYSAVILKLDQLNQGVVRVETAMNRIESVTKKKASGFASFWKNAFQTAFGFGIIQIINKVTTAMRGALNVFSGFQQSMRNVQSVTKATGEDFRVMEEAAKNAGETTRFTARQAADALYYLGSAGFSAQQSIAALDGVLQLAGATQSDLASTSETVASIISQYSLAAEDATDISNIFAAAITNSQATMEKLSNSFRQVGPVAAGFGYSVEETVGVLQELYNAGFRGQQAGRALKSALADLASPTANMEKIFSKLNISLEDVNPATNEFADIIDTLAESGADTADIIDAFGKIAGPQMAVLIKQGGDSLRDYTEAVTDTNAAAEAYAIQNDSLAGSMDFLKSKMESTAIAIFEKVEPGMRELIDSFIDFLDATRPIGEALGVVLNILFKIASFSTGAITKLFEGLLGTFRNIKTPMQEAADEFDNVREAIQRAGEIENTANRLQKLTEEYEKLTSKTDLTEREQDRLKKVISEIEDIAPDAAKGIDDYGKAIEISGEKSREAARQMLESRKAIIEQSKASLEVVKPSLEGLLEVRERQLKQLKKEEQLTADVNRITEGRFSTLNEMKIVYQDLLKRQVELGGSSLRLDSSFTLLDEAFLRFSKDLNTFNLPAEKFKNAGNDITEILGIIDQELINTERDYKNYQQALDKRIEVEIEVLDIRKKLDELANLELELKNLDEGIKAIGESTSEAAGDSEEYADAATDFWTDFRASMAEATREATLFGDKQEVLRATLDFLKDAYLELIEKGLDPAGETLTRLRQEYDLIALELEEYIRLEKESEKATNAKEAAEKKIIELTKEYKDKLEELKTPQEELMELERQRAIASVLASGATQEAIQAAIDAINEYYDKLQENITETKEGFKLDLEEMLDYASQFANALIALFSSITDRRIEEIDRQMEAELEAAGLNYETERERLEREKQEAIEAGDEITAQEKQDAIDRLDIEEKYERKKAELQYEAEMTAWKLKLAAAIASAAQAVLSGYATQPFIPVGLAAGTLAFGLGAIQVAAVYQQEPQPPSFDTGGIFTGSNIAGPSGGYMAELHNPEMVLNQEQMSNLFNAIDSGRIASDKPIRVSVILQLDKYDIGKAVAEVANNGQITFTSKAFR